MRRGLPVFIGVFQSILLAAHLLVFETWLHFWGPVARATMGAAGTVMFLLSLSFLVATLLSFKYWNGAMRALYRVAAVWLGVFNFLFMASVGVWLTFLFAAMTNWNLSSRAIVVGWFGTALGAALWGLVNASFPRISRIKIRLPNLPEAWRGRTAAMISDFHLGHVCGANFARNIRASIRQLSAEMGIFSRALYYGSQS